jgi:hypothetical protein
MINMSCYRYTLLIVGAKKVKKKKKEKNKKDRRIGKRVYLYI